MIETDKVRERFLKKTYYSGNYVSFNRKLNKLRANIIWLLMRKVVTGKGHVPLNSGLPDLTPIGKRFSNVAYAKEFYVPDGTGGNNSRRKRVPSGKQRKSKRPSKAS